MRTVFFLAGYPSSLTKKIGSWVAGGFSTVYTKRLPQTPSEAKLPVDPDLDLFFEYGKDGTTLDGMFIKTLVLPGKSAASIWECKVNVSGITMISIIGVQSAYIHSKWFRGKNWWAVAKILEQIDNQLAVEVQSNLKLLME